MELQTNFEQRVVNVEVLTWKHWISGKVHILKWVLFLDAVNNMANFLKVVDAELDNGNRWPFLALQHKAIEVIVPFGEDRENIVRKDFGTNITKRVKCILPKGEIEGDFHLPSKIRVSDFLSKAANYIPIHNPRIDIPAQHLHTESTAGEDMPTALVNTENVIGVIEI